MTQLATVEKTTNITERTAVSFVPFGQAESLTITLHDVKNVIAAPTKSGAQPSEKDCILFMELCRARGLNPYVGDAWLLGYDGRDGAQFSLITSIQALLKRAEANKDFDGIESGLIVETGSGEVKEVRGAFKAKDWQILGAWAKVHRKERKIPHEARVNFDVFNQKHSRWNVDPAGMIVKCAKAAALREAFPTELGGLYTQEEGHPQERRATGRVIDEETGKTLTAGVPKEEEPDAVAEPEPTGYGHETAMVTLEEEGIDSSDFLAFYNESKNDDREWFQDIPIESVKKFIEGLPKSKDLFVKWRDKA